MDNLTHTLTAWLAARALRLGSGPAPYATPALIVAANIPDIDLLYLFDSPTTYLAYHRTWTHSLPGAAALGAVVALAFWSLARSWSAKRTAPEASDESDQERAEARRRQPQPHRFRHLLLVCVLGALSHPLMDWTTAYGTQLLWPFDRTRYALDWFFILDPSLLAILVLGLALPALFRLIGEEIGTRSSPGGARRGAWLALAAYILLAAGRATLHGDAVAQLESRLYDEQAPVRVGAFPTPLNPFRWVGVVETETTFEMMELMRLADGGYAAENPSTFYKPAASPALEAARTTRTARIFLDWARFPHAEILPLGDGVRVRIQDLRYFDETARRSRFLVWIDLSRRGEILEESLRFGRRGPEPPP